jgi:MarR family 2-MHQ and catechol resistance regulon transcriptional repressor
MSLNKELELDRPIEDVRHEAVLNIIRTANLLSQKGAERFRDYDLTVAQFNVLFALKYKERHLSQADLGKRLVVTRASVTSVLDKLESKGLVARVEVPDNRRIYHVELTAGGKTLVDEVEQHYRQDIQDVLHGFSESECRRLIQGLERVRARCRVTLREA